MSPSARIADQPIGAETVEEAGDDLASSPDHVGQLLLRDVVGNALITCSGLSQAIRESKQGPY